LQHADEFMACLSGVASSICGGSGAGHAKALPAPPAHSLATAESPHQSASPVPQPRSLANSPPKLADVLDLGDKWADGSQHADEESSLMQVHSPADPAPAPKAAQMPPPFSEATFMAAAHSAQNTEEFPNALMGAGNSLTPRYDHAVSNNNPLDSEYDGLDSTVNASVRPKLPRDIAFFSGSWSGSRNDWTGDVGINFVIENACTITALGRHVQGTILREIATVTLWHAGTQEVSAVAHVGPCSVVEGHYAFETLDTPIHAKAGEEYRLTTRCRGGMPDKWNDDRATAAEVAARCAPGLVRFIGGVCRNNYGYPSREDGEFRRAGIVNFKTAIEPIELLPVTRAELASKIAQSAAIAAYGDPRDTDATILIVAGLLALLVDELAALPGITASVVVAHDDLIQQRLQLEPADTEADLSRELAGEVPGVPGCSIRDQRFARELVSFARQRSSIGTNGSPALDDPLEGAFVVSSRTGRVLAAAARLLRGPQPLTGAELVTTLGSGMVFVRSADGAVAALLGTEAQKCCALVIKNEESG